MFTLRLLLADADDKLSPMELLVVVAAIEPNNVPEIIRFRLGICYYLLSIGVCVCRSIDVKLFIE